MQYEDGGKSHRRCYFPFGTQLHGHCIHIWSEDAIASPPQWIFVLWQGRTGLVDHCFPVRPIGRADGDEPSESAGAPEKFCKTNGHEAPLFLHQVQVGYPLGLHEPVAQ